MKKLFVEPEIEILNFLCDQGVDSPSTSPDEDGTEGGLLPQG